MKTQYTAALATLVGIAVGGAAIHGLHAQTKPVLMPSLKSI
jgi:hypothetical protein